MGGQPALLGIELWSWNIAGPREGGAATLLEQAFHNCVHVCNRQHLQLSSFEFKLTWETAPGKMRVIPFVTHAPFKRIFAFPLTERVQKGCDPRVHPLQGLLEKEKARISPAGNSQVKLPHPVREQLVYALKNDGISAKKERKKGRSSIHPSTAAA